MAIVSISDTKGSRALSWSGQSGRVYTLEVLIVTDDATMGPRQVLKSMGMNNGDHYRFPLYVNNQSNPDPTEFDWGSFVQSLDLKEEAADGKQWRATIQYAPYDWGSQGGYTTEGASEGVFDPFAIPPEVRWASQKYERACQFDRAGNPIRNTVGDEFDPPLKRDDSRPILTIVQNEPNFDIGRVQSFKDTVNSDVFLGFDPNTVKCQDITAERVYHADWGYYWRVTYEFEIRPIYIPKGSTTPVDVGWTELVLNAGYRYLSVATGNPAPVLVQGAPVSAPVALTQAGQYVPAASPYYLAFDIYPASEFAGLPIDQTLLSVGSSPGEGGS
jgi:hypothetical protein